MLSERIFFFNNTENKRLLGFLHLPAKIKSRTGIIYIPPFAEEQNCSQAIIVKAARAFAQTSFPVMRFDLRGSGDSEGDLSFCTIEDWLQDVNDAIEYFKKETGITTIAIWGLRTGCGIGLLAALNRMDIDFYILWQPVFNFEKFINQFIRQKLSSEIMASSEQVSTMKTLLTEIEKKGQIEVVGYSISKELYNSFVQTGNIENKYPDAVKSFIVSVSLMEKPNYALLRFVKHLQAKKVPFIFKHIRAETFWDKYWQWDLPLLVEETKLWLQNEIKGTV